MFGPEADEDEDDNDNDNDDQVLWPQETHVVQKLGGPPWRLGADHCPPSFGKWFPEDEQRGSWCRERGARLVGGMMGQCSE